MSAQLMPSLSRFPRTAKFFLWLAVMILLITSGWLVWHWPPHGLWYDEALTTYVATDSWATLWGWCTQVDIQVPLHYVVLRGWVALLGNSEFALRLLSALCIVLAVAGAIAAGKRAAGAGLGYVMGLLLALLPGTLWLGYEVRAYALALALYSWATVFLLHLICTPRFPLRWLLGYGLLMIAALYTHYTALAGFAAHVLLVVLFIFVQRSSYLFKLTMGMLIIVGLGFAPWLPIMLTRGATDRSYYVGQPIPPYRSAAVMLGFKLLAREDAPDVAAALVTGYAVLLGAAVVVGLTHRREKLQLATLTGALIGLIPAAITAALVYFRPKLAGRYAWPIWLGVDMLLGVLVVWLARRWRAAGGVALMLLIALPWLTGLQGHPPISGYREAFAAICDHGTPHDVIILRDGTLFVTAIYYLRRPPCDGMRYTLGLPMALITDVTVALTYPDAVKARQTIVERQPPNVWVVSWQADNMDPQGMGLGLLDDIGAHTWTGRLYGDVRLDRYENIRPPATAAWYQAQPTIDLPMPDGPSLHAPHLVSPLTMQTGDVLVVQAWWLRGAQLYPDLRVSAQLTSIDGGWTYAQVDQPPAGWKYLDDRWQTGIPVLGRYELPVGSDVPSGKVAVRLVIYDIANRWPPHIISVGEVTVIQAVQ